MRSITSSVTAWSPDTALIVPITRPASTPTAAEHDAAGAEARRRCDRDRVIDVAGTSPSLRRHTRCATSAEEHSRR